ncbi:MAG TPA: TonB family protein [Adhaeribacter sp.]|nr:TonB family protein [Adhaeribacter sp.]
MRLLAFPILFFLSFSASAQTTQFLDKHHQPVADSAAATFFTKTFKNPNTLEAVVRKYYLDGTRVSEEQFSNIEMHVHGGITKTWHPNGQLKQEISYQNNVFQGPLKTYYSNGQLRRTEHYNQGKAVGGRCFTASGADTACTAFQTFPKFPGGDAALMNFIKNNLRRPAGSERASGLVVVSFTVTAEGKTSDIIIRKGLNPAIDKEVIRVVSRMPAWTPGQLEGENLPQTYNLPVRF